MQPHRFASLARDVPLEGLLPRLIQVLSRLAPEELKRVLVQLDGALERTSSEPNAALARLTPTERKVFDLAVRGASNADMARTLSITVKTVQTHRARINWKLGVHSPAELVRFAAREGLI